MSDLCEYEDCSCKEASIYCVGHAAELQADTVAALEAGIERLSARNEHLEKRFGYLEGDWERRNHIIESLTARNAELEAAWPLAREMEIGENGLDFKYQTLDEALAKLQVKP
jgi:hypothetical protein